MDPNANVARQRELVTAIRDLCTSPVPLENFAEQLEALASELVDVVEALDEWIGKGGFLPDAWRMPCPVCQQPAIVLLVEGEPGHEHRELVCETCRRAFAQVPAPAPHPFD